MSAADAWLARMRTVLAAERIAIRKMNAKSVEEAAREKELLLAELERAIASDADQQAMLGALALVREELKRNLVFLAHARDSVRDAIARARPKGIAPGSRLSIRL